MGSILTHGVFLPAEGERNCYEGLAANWTALDRLIGGYNAHIGNTTIHVTAADKEAWNGKADASALTAHTGDTTIHVTAADKEAWNGKADASALTAHTGDTTIHVTAADKQAWNGKADASALTAHTGDTTIHVTAEDKTKWDAVTGKANDADVVHKSGTETVGGKKTFTDEVTASKNATNAALNLQNLSYDPKTNGQSAIGSTKSFSVYLLTSTSDLFSAVSFYGASDRTIIRFTARYYTDSENFYNDSLEYILYRDGTKTFRPRNNNNTILGESNRKWNNLYSNQINSLEPSSLSLPDLANGIDISGYIDVSQASTNYYTPPVNGWISITITTSVRASIHIECGGGFRSCAYSGADPDNPSNSFISSIIIPCVKNDTATIYFRCPSGGTIKYAKFFPCQGNI